MRAIFVTFVISKVAESFICRFFNNYFNNFIDVNQFGCTNNRSTVHALIKLSDVLSRSSDDATNITRILFLDFLKRLILLTITSYLKNV